MEHDQFYPENKEQWRNWLIENHIDKQSIWLISYNRRSDKPSVSWSDSVDEALCFGWIDSLKKKLDAESSIQYFSKRKAKSTWSKINKDKIQVLLEAGLMFPAGIDSVEIAKKNGSWNILDSVEALLIPADLERELKNSEEGFEFFSGLSKSVRKMMLYWVISAKRPETREKRILEIAKHAAEKKKPKPF